MNNSPSISRALSVLAVTGMGLMANTSCSTGVLFADDRQEGLVGFVSATRYDAVADVLTIKEGVAPKLVLEETLVIAPVAEVAAITETEPTSGDAPIFRVAGAVTESFGHTETGQ